MAETLETTKEINKKPSTKLKIVAMVVVVLAILFLVGFLGTKNIQLTEQKPVIKNTLPEGYQYVATKAGEYPVGFPKELVIFKDAKILRGENTTNDGAGGSHKIIEYTVAQPSADVFSQYQTKLPPLGWKLSGQPVTQGTLQILNFTKDQTALTIIVAPQTATTSQVSLDVI